MARIRSCKPEWWKSAKWCRLPRDLRSTYKGIWEVMCDDEGRFLADPRQVKADVWPLDDDITPKKLNGWLLKLAEVLITVPEGMGGGKAPAVQFYETDGVKYGYLAGFVEHQKISHPTPSKLPKPPSIDRNDSGSAPEDSGVVQEIFRPEEERDVDLDVEGDLDKDEEMSIPEQAPEMNGAPPRVVLPHEAERFLAQFYEPIGPIGSASRARYTNVKGQLYDVLDPLHPGPKLRGGKRVKARSLEHLADKLKVVMKDPPPNRDHAILWVLNKLLDPPKGPTETEVFKQREEQERLTEDQYHAAMKRAGIEWANSNPEAYAPILRETDANYRGKDGAFVAMARTAELTQRCARAAEFPSFEEWKEAQTAGAT